jgi:hypothetical protein
MIGPMHRLRRPAETLGAGGVPAGGAAGPARRSVLALGAVALVVGLAGCGVRLEDDAPDIPLIPTRQPIPGERALLGLLAQTVQLAKGAEAIAPRGGTTVSALATLHPAQATRLSEVLRAKAVPARLVRAAGTGRTPVAASAVSAAALGRLEAQALEAGAQREALVVGADLLPMVCALLAQRAAAAALLGVVVPRHAGVWPHAALAVGPLQAFRSAVYGLEVVTAQSSGTDRSRGQATLARLRTFESQAAALAGRESPPAELGYTLPFPVRSAGSARRLARQTLAGLRDTLAAQFGGLAAAEPGGRGAAPQVIRWLGASEAELHRWGGALTPFPGLR